MAYDSVNDDYYFADSNNNRIVIWTGGLSNALAPDRVLGQSVFTTSSAATTTTGLRAPTSVCIGGGKIFVSDTNNHRIVSYQGTLPPASGATWSVVLGQANFTGNSANRGLGAPTSSSLNRPTQMYCDDNKLIVLDSSNNRVLVWTTLPTVSDTPADLVIGQSSFTTSDCGTGLNGICGVNAMGFDGSDLFLREPLKRIIKFSGPFTNGQMPSAELKHGEKINPLNQNWILSASTTFRWGVTIRPVGTDHLAIDDGTFGRILLIPKF